MFDFTVRVRPVYGLPQLRADCMLSHILLMNVLSWQLIFL